MKEGLARDIDDLNCIIRFLARRDLEALTSAALFCCCGVRQADTIILLGGITTPDFVDVVACAYHLGLAKGLMVVGGSGHSTQNLRNNIASHPQYGAIATAGRTEADMLCDILVNFHGIDRNAIVVENRSTNCGNNATYALQVVERAKSIPGNALIVQDSIMQRRTHESFLHSWQAESTKFMSFAPMIPLLTERNGAIVFADPACERHYRFQSFMALVMGEIPRLRDDVNGYGPNGRAFIGHVEIPETVSLAFDRLVLRYSEYVRPT